MIIAITVTAVKIKCIYPKVKSKLAKKRISEINAAIEKRLMIFELGDKILLSDEYKESNVIRLQQLGVYKVKKKKAPCVIDLAITPQGSIILRKSQSIIPGAYRLAIYAHEKG